MELLDYIFKKELYVPFNNVEIRSNNDNLIVAGTGRLCKNGEIEIIVDGKPASSRSLFIFSRNRGGGIIFEEDMWHAQGDSASIKLIATGVRGKHTGSVLPNTFWAKNVRLEADGETKNYSLTRLTSSPSIIRSRTARAATHFNLKEHLLWSWGKIEVSGMLFSLVSNEGSFLYCEHPIDEEYLNRESALLTAIGFVASQYIDVTARYEANTNSFVLREAVESSEQWTSPIKWSEQADEIELVRLIAEMVFADGTNRIRSILRHYLTYPGPLFVPLRSLHVCILIEALLTTLQEIKQWRYGSDLKAKYDYAIKGLKLPKNDEEFKIFKQVRDDLAHGKISDPYLRDDAAAQEEYNRMHVLNNIFNKLILGASGYSGSYFDYDKQNILSLGQSEIAKG